MPDPGRFIGKRFADGGRGPHVYDCWGLVMAVFAEFGIRLPDFRISCFATRAVGRTVTGQKRFWIKTSRPSVPALAVMAIDPDHPGVCNHCGVYVGGGKILHTTQKTGAVMTPADHPYWGSRIEGYYLFAGVSSEDLSLDEAGTPPIHLVSV